MHLCAGYVSQIKLIHSNPTNYNIILVEITSASFVLGTKTLTNFETFPMNTRGMSLKLIEQLEIVVLLTVMCKNHIYNLQVVVIPAVVEIDLCRSVLENN